MVTERRGREVRRAERRQQLLAAARDAIRTVGPSVTMEQLASAGGVTKPILYRHFGDRDGLVAALGERLGAEIVDSVLGPLAAGADGPRELLATTVDAYLGFIEREPALYRFLVQQTRPIGPLETTTLIDAIATRVAVVIGEELRRAGLDSGGAVPWAYGIVGMVHEAGDWWLDNPTMSRERLVAYLSNLLWHGLGSGGGAGPARSEA